MKKLVPSSRSNSIMMPPTNSAGKASSASTVAVKMPQTVSGIRISVMPRGARLQHRHHVVQAAHREADDEQDQRDQHQDDAAFLPPGVPARIACGGYSVQPAPVGPPGTKKLATSTSTASR